MKIRIVPHNSSAGAALIIIGIWLAAVSGWIMNFQNL